MGALRAPAVKLTVTVARLHPRLTQPKLSVVSVIVAAHGQPNLRPIRARALVDVEGDDGGDAVESYVEGREEKEDRLGPRLPRRDRLDADELKEQRQLGQQIRSRDERVVVGGLALHMGHVTEECEVARANDRRHDRTNSPGEVPALAEPLCNQ